MEVEIVESSLVVPCEDTPNHSIWLSNIDLMAAAIKHTPTITVFRPNGDPNFFSIEIIKPALAKVLVHFYPLAGRLGIGGDGRLEIMCSGEGVLFVVARSSASLDSLDNFTPPEEMRRLLVPPTDSSDRCNMCIVLQVTFFACGGVCLGIAMHHAVTDGLSAFHFINTWSDIARGAEGDVVPPSFDHTPLRARSPPVVAFDHYECKPPQPDKNSDRHAVTSPKAFRTVTARINMSKDQIASLKRCIGGETGRVSTFSVLSALAWRCMCRARKIEPNQEIQLFMPVSIRNRLTPPLDPHYFGNAIVRKSVSAAAGDIASQQLLVSVDAIAAAIARVDDEYARSYVDSLEQMDDIMGVGLGPWLETRDVWVISWLTLPTHEADFGWGRPVFMGRADLGLCGSVFMLRSPESDGGVTLLTAMEQENVKEFRELLQLELDAIKPAEACP